MRYGKFWRGTQHRVVVNDGESVSNIVDNVLDGASEVGVGGCGCNKAVPEAHSVVGFASRLLH